MGNSTRRSGLVAPSRRKRLLAQTAGESLLQDRWAGRLSVCEGGLVRAFQSGEDANAELAPVCSMLGSRLGQEVFPLEWGSLQQCSLEIQAGVTLQTKHSR